MLRWGGWNPPGRCPKTPNKPHRPHEEKSRALSRHPNYWTVLSGRLLATCWTPLNWRMRPRASLARVHGTLAVLSLLVSLVGKGELCRQAQDSPQLCTSFNVSHFIGVFCGCCCPALAGGQTGVWTRCSGDKDTHSRVCAIRRTAGMCFGESKTDKVLRGNARLYGCC